MSYHSPLALLLDRAEDAPTPVREAAAELRRVYDESAKVFAERDQRARDLDGAQRADRDAAVAAIREGKAPTEGTRAAEVTQDLQRLDQMLEAYYTASSESESRFLYVARQHLPAWLETLAEERLSARAALRELFTVNLAEANAGMARIDELDGLKAVLDEVGTGMTPTAKTLSRGFARRPVLAISAAALPAGEFGQVILDPESVLAALGSYPDRPELHFVREAYEFVQRGPNDFNISPAYNPDDADQYDMAGALAAVEDE